MKIGLQGVPLCLDVHCVLSSLRGVCLVSLDVAYLCMGKDIMETPTTEFYAIVVVANEQFLSEMGPYISYT